MTEPDPVEITEPHAYEPLADEDPEPELNDDADDTFADVPEGEDDGDTDLDDPEDGSDD